MLLPQTNKLKPTNIASSSITSTPTTTVNISPLQTSVPQSTLLIPSEEDGGDVESDPDSESEDPGNGDDEEEDEEDIIEDEDDEIYQAQNVWNGQ
ncbi:hypothetical protein BGW42_004944 [Actinomortierella wolfii]|nr:hypothetical protein BGW42_004944 [Actinomortierella wolfii]